MNNSEKLQRIIEDYEVKRDEMVEKCINDAINAFDQVVKKIDESLYVRVKRLSHYNRWIVVVGSKLFRDSDTSVAAIEQSDTKLSVRINLIESKGLGDNEIVIGAADSQELANVLGVIYKSDEFKIKLRVYSELSSKDKFEMTIFMTELHRYTPSDLYLSVNRAWLINNFDSTEEIDLPKNEYDAVHQPYRYLDYIGRYGVVNGAILKVINADDAGHLRVKFIA
jgi:hypothetical protein